MDWDDEISEAAHGPWNNKVPKSPVPRLNGIVRSNNVQLTSAVTLNTSRTPSTSYSAAGLQK